MKVAVYLLLLLQQKINNKKNGGPNNEGKPICLLGRLDAHHLVLETIGVLVFIKRILHSENCVVSTLAERYVTGPKYMCLTKLEPWYSCK